MPQNAPFMTLAKVYNGGIQDKNPLIINMSNRLYMTANPETVEQVKTLAKRKSLSASTILKLALCSYLEQQKEV